MARLSIIAPEGFPRIAPGDVLSAQILAAAAAEGGLQDGDIIVLAQKIVSKAEGRQVDLASVTPSPEAVRLGGITHKDPRLVELILSESQAVMRAVPGVIITRHRLGFVMANAGIDQSNLSRSDAGAEHALLLPLDPDASAAALRAALEAASGLRLAVLIIDSFGRAWRQGTCGTTIGSAGIVTLQDLRGQHDYFGRRLETSELGFADEIAASASLLMGQAGEGRPVAILRGLDWRASDATAQDLVRPAKGDLFP